MGNTEAHKSAQHAKQFHFHPEKMCQSKKICFTSFQRLSSKHVGRGPSVNTTSSCYNALNTIKCMQEGGLRGCFTYWIIFTLSCIMDKCYSLHLPLQQEPIPASLYSQGRMLLLSVADSLLSKLSEGVKDLSSGSRKYFLLTDCCILDSS